MAASSLAAMILIICPWFGGFTPGAQAAESAALERINFGFSAAGSVASAPLWMAQDSGAFRKYGLDVKPIFLAGGLAPVAVVAGEVPFALMSAGVMVPALSNYLNQVAAVAPDYIADALDHYNRDLDDRPFPRAEGVKIALELTAQ